MFSFVILKMFNILHCDYTFIVSKIVNMLIYYNSENALLI